MQGWLLAVVFVTVVTVFGFRDRGFHGEDAVIVETEGVALQCCVVEVGLEGLGDSADAG